MPTVITEQLRSTASSAKLAEFYGLASRQCPWPTEPPSGNMLSSRFGSTAAMFP
jgi:hypothetical protein